MTKHKPGARIGTMPRKTYENPVFHEYLRQKADQKFGGALERLWIYIGYCKVMVYRCFWKVPWKHTGARDLKLATRIAQRMPDNLGHVLWQMGYNPFVTEGLSAIELTHMYELMLRLSRMLKDGSLHDAGSELGTTLAMLHKDAERRRIANAEPGEHVEGPLGDGEGAVGEGDGGGLAALLRRSELRENEPAPTK